MLSLLGKGGMGAVYLARHDTLGVRRAIKVLTKLGPGPTARFVREASHLAQVQHPNVVRIHDVGSERGVCYFAMEYVEGESLSRMLHGGALPWRRALEIAVEVARGVDALHEVGVIHRDLKPGNVMLTPEGRAVVVDLGVAVAPDSDERLTRTNTTVGTMAYMPLEQLQSGTRLGR